MPEAVGKLTPTEIAEKLREELDDLYLRPVLKPQPGTDYSGGVGTPCLAEIQDEGIGPYLLFTGWTNPKGDGREVFIGEIDEDFQVSNIRKILGATEISNFTRHNAISLLYDGSNEWWNLFTSSTYTPDGGNVACLFRYDKTFTNRIATYAPLYLSDGSLFRAIDSGVGVKWGYVGLRVFAVFVKRDAATGLAQGLYGSYCTDFTATPPVFQTPRRIFPASTEIQPGTDYSDYPIPILDILQLVEWKDWNVVLAEEITDFEWKIVPYFIHKHRDYSTRGSATDRFIGIAGRASEALASPYTSNFQLNYGHPFLTWLPNRKLNLFFAMFPNNPPSYKHEIWVMRLPESRLDPKSYRALTYVPWYNDDIAANETSRAFPAYGKTTIYFKTDTSGDLTIEVDPLGDGDWETFDTITGVSARIAPYHTEHAGNSIRLKFSEAANVTAKVVVTF